MTDIIKVAILGATGETGGLVLDGLLKSKDPQFELIALARSSSVEKPEYARLALRGVKIVVIDLDGPEAELAQALQGIDVVIASVPPNVLETQLPLARAAKQAGVKRFLPSSYAMAIAPGGVSTAQDAKEAIYSELAAIDLPFTIVDEGWWHFGFIPRLPSGRTDYAIALPDFLINMIPGDGNMKTCLVDTQDSGSLLASIITDPRTINKRVMANGDVLTLNEIYDTVQRVTGETAELNYVGALAGDLVSASQLEAMIQQVKLKIEGGQNDYMTLVGQFWLEYYYSSFVLGDNSPEGVHRLGYVMASDLYPDFKPVKFEQFFREVLDGKKRIPYSRE